MSGAETKAARKQSFFGKLLKLLDEYNKVFIVGADNVGSSHLQKIRVALRGKGVILMGKNTMIRKVIRGHLENNKALESLLPLIRGNVGFIFVKEDLSFVRKIVEESKIAAPAKAGSIAPCDVIVPAGPTGMEPTQTSFLQALNIPSKIARGQIEIINDVPLIMTGARVGTSEAALLAKLDIKPFKYGLVIKTVYDNGTVYDAAVLALTDEDILAKFHAGVRNIASIGLQIGYPTIASLPHSIIRGYKNVLSVALATDISFPAVDKIKHALANPTAHAPAAAKKEEAAPKEDKKKAKEEPKEEEAEEEMGFGLFD